MAQSTYPNPQPPTQGGCVVPELNGFRTDCCGVLSIGRMMFSECAMSLMRTMQLYQYDLSINQGAYWEQALTRAIKQGMSLNRKYLLFFDGDSVWEPSDLGKLYQFMESHPLVDAVYPIQADRNGPNPLVFNWQAGPRPAEYNLNEDFVEYGHGHFGLSMIRTKLFRELPEPWFVSVPGSDGSWDQDKGKIDADTYFWIKFNRAGRCGVQANKISIGHIQAMIRWQVGPEVVCQTFAEHAVGGKPFGARTPTVDEVRVRDDKIKVARAISEIARIFDAKNLDVDNIVHGAYKKTQQEPPEVVAGHVPESSIHTP